MTLPRSETPLRRSAVGSYRESMVRDMTIINDDEAERREARRRTLLQQRPRDSSVAESIEDNETIRKCLEIYNGNKLSRDNAWSLSLIDTLSNLLDRHHKSLSNFKMAGSSLEASSKVYGLRVDSIYLDAMRMSAGLNARKLTEQQLNAADNEDAEAPAGDGAVAANDAAGAAPKPKKRARKVVSTVTKNKDSLNARLDTAPLQDPVFGKLNSTVGSINASNRLMHNILPTRDSELRLRTNYRFWDSSDLTEEVVDYTVVVRAERYEPEQLASAKWAQKLLRYDQQLVLRPLHTGYVITDAPNPSAHGDDKKLIAKDEADDEDNHDHADNVDYYDNGKELSMAFDINAECEPMPDLDAQPAVLEVDFNDLEELTTEEQTALQHCRGLRKRAMVIDDLRPVDGNSKLEYSYRPMDKISQFWAGPSHWKFKRSRGRSTFGQSNKHAVGQSGGLPSSETGGQAQKGRRAQQLAAKRRSKKLEFGESHDELFLPLETNTKLRKANMQKKWDSRKLMLPTKYTFEPNYFFRYDYAPSIKVTRRFGEAESADEYDDDGLDAHHADGPDDVELFDNEHFTADNSATSALGLHESGSQGVDVDAPCVMSCSNANDTVLEIATEFEGAPTQVTKVVVPFAKRAKVIDMKNLKVSCNALIQKQLLNLADEASIPVHPTVKPEQYAKGVASFKEVYDKLPNLVTPKMADSLSPSVALYAVLHLANDMKLRLIPQEDMKDFKIRQVLDRVNN